MHGVDLIKGMSLESGGWGWSEQGRGRRFPEGGQPRSFRGAQQFLGRQVTPQGAASELAYPIPSCSRG